MVIIIIKTIKLVVSPESNEVLSLYLRHGMCQSPTSIRTSRKPGEGVESICQASGWWWGVFNCGGGAQTSKAVWCGLNALHRELP